MSEYFCVEASWPQPQIHVDHHDPPCPPGYYPDENMILIAIPDCTPEYLIVVLSHEMTHWGVFRSLAANENPMWFEAMVVDSSIFHRARQAMELMAYWSGDTPVPEYLLQLASHRRTRRIIKHRDGTRSWRSIPLADPITDEEIAICKRLEASRVPIRPSFDVVPPVVRAPDPAPDYAPAACSADKADRGRSE